MDDRLRELERRARGGDQEASAALRVVRRRMGLGQAPFLPRCVRCDADNPPIHTFDANFCTDLPEERRAPSLCRSCLDEWHGWRNDLLGQFLIRLGEPPGRLVLSTADAAGRTSERLRLENGCWRCLNLGRKEESVRLHLSGSIWHSATTVDHPRLPLQSRGGGVRSRVYTLCQVDYLAWVKISGLMFLDFLDGWLGIAYPPEVVTPPDELPR